MSRVRASEVRPGPVGEVVGGARGCAFCRWGPRWTLLEDGGILGVHGCKVRRGSPVEGAQPAACRAAVPGLGGPASVTLGVLVSDSEVAIA